MLPNGENVERVTLAHLLGLVERSEPETLTLEYKVQFETDWREWRKDIVAFANANGGCFAIGVLEENGCAKELVGVPKSEVDAKLLGLTSTAHGQIEPRLKLIHKQFEVAPGRVVLLIGVPSSPYGPHRRSCDGKFFQRRTVGVLEMNYAEIQRAFRSASLERDLLEGEHREAIERSRSERSVPHCQLDLVALPYDDTRFVPSDQKLSGLAETSGIPSAVGASSGGFTFDGRVWRSAGTRDVAFAQVGLRRNGSASYRFALPLVVRDSAGMIGPKATTMVLIKATTAYFKFAVEAGIAGPFLGMLTMTKCRNQRFFWSPDGFLEPSEPCERDTYSFPSLSFSEAPPTRDETALSIKTWLDMLWNAAGAPSCLLFAPSDQGLRWQALE